MIEWIGRRPEDSVAAPVERVADHVLEMGSAPPEGLLFLDREGTWRNVAAAMTLSRRRAVVGLTLEERELAAAVRLSIGGALLLPVSTARLSAALGAVETVASAPQWFGGPDIVEEIARQENSSRIFMAPRDAWRDLVGIRGQLELLTVLASKLGRPAVIGDGPDLLAADADRDEVERAWDSMSDRPVWARDTRFLRVVRGKRRWSTPRRGGGPWPVADWPSGRTVARWSPVLSGADRSWTICGVDGETLDAAAATTSLDLEVGDVGIFRLEGVPPSELERPGSPGSVLAVHLAREARRRGRMLWIPGVGRRAAAVIRRWNCPVLIDGPILERS